MGSTFLLGLGEEGVSLFCWSAGRGQGRTFFILSLGAGMGSQQPKTSPRTNNNKKQPKENTPTKHATQHSALVVPLRCLASGAFGFQESVYTLSSSSHAAWPPGALRQKIRLQPPRQIRRNMVYRNIPPLPKHGVATGPSLCRRTKATAASGKNQTVGTAALWRPLVRHL